MTRGVVCGRCDDVDGVSDSNSCASESASFLDVESFRYERSAKTHGLGIGLPLVQRTVERMGGALSISSHSGRGTLVIITIPQI